MKLLGLIAHSTKPLVIEPYEWESQFDKWGKAIIEELKKHGYYINKVKGDPSGRW